MPLTGPQNLLANLAKLEKLRDANQAQGLREFQRFVVRGDAELHAMGRDCIDQAPIPIQLRDIGREGVGFLCQRDLDVNSTWRVTFLHDGYRVGQEGVIIRHCTFVQPGVFLIGAQFCIESGLLALLGVDPTLMLEGDAPTIVSGPRFLAPGEVA